MPKKRRQPRPQQDGLIPVDAEKVERLLVRRGWSKTKLADEAEHSRNTVLRIFRGEGVFAESLKNLAQALDVADPNDLVRRGDGAPAAAPGSGPSGDEWEIDAEHCTPWITASNGLQLRICRMRHKYVADRRGRGKWYDLFHLPSRERERLHEHLLRHPTVCERIGPHPHIVENLSTAPGASGDAWWVIDRWIEGQTLEEILSNGLLDPSELPRVMTEVVRGLEALHQAQVVFRELAPRRVLIAAGSGRAVLTDFELAKLVGAGPTVSADWPDDPYRAPEVESGTADERSDLYSWARILLHAGTGALPPAGDDEVAAAGLGLPKKLSRVVAACLSPAPSDRPKSIREVLQALRDW